jgi:MFS family permease
MLLMFALYGVFNAFYVGVSRALVGDLVMPAKRATAYGIYNAATGLGLLFASLIAGIFWDWLGLSTVFYFGAILAGIAFVGLVVFRLVRPKVWVE